MGVGCVDQSAREHGRHAHGHGRYASAGRLQTCDAAYGTRLKRACAFQSLGNVDGHGKA